MSQVLIASVGLLSGVVRRPADQAVAVEAETGRPVIGSMTTNAPYVKPDALHAAEAGILLYHARLPQKWRKRADWRLNSELQPLHGPPGAQEL